MKKTIATFLILGFYGCVISAQVDTTFFIPLQPIGMEEGRYARYTGMIKEGFKHKNSREISESKRSRYLNNIAAAYMNLKANPKRVFYWLHRSVDVDSYTQCKSILGWNKDLGHYQRCDSILWAKICKRCEAYMNSDEAKQIELKKQENRRKEQENLNPNLVAEIEQIAIDDQKYRQEIIDSENKYGENTPQVDSLWSLQHQLDSMNLVKIEAFIQKYGYPIHTMVGRDYQFVAFLVIQHSSIKTMKYYLPLFMELAKRGDLGTHVVTLMIDRIHASQFGTQIYGTQSSNATISLYKEKEHIMRLDKLSKGQFVLGQITLSKYLIIDVGDTCKITYP